MPKQTWKGALVVALLEFGVALNAQQGTTIKRVPATRTWPEDAPAMFRTYCASCHGADAKGGGPAGAALKVRPADLTTLSKRNKGKFPEVRVYNAIDGGLNMPAHGSREMPIWGEVFHSMSGADQGESKLRIRNLTKYIESIQVK